MAKDIYHDAVKKALEKNGWNITDDPYFIHFPGSLKYEIDLGAEKIIGAEKESQKIAVEINSSFFKIPFITDLIKFFGINTIVFNEESGDIIKWKG